MQLKESDYNFIYDDLGKDQIVFYNSRTGALAVVHEAQYQKSVGNINTPGNYIYRTDLIDAYSAFDWKLYLECEACKMLPTCLGGCPNKRLDGNIECNHIKFGMSEYLVRCTEALLSRTRQASKAPV